MMKAHKERKTWNLKFFMLIIALLLSLFITEAISMNDIANYTVEETHKLSFSLQASEYNGTVSFSRTPAEGTLTKINDSLANFEWTPAEGENGTYIMAFAATDSTNTVSKQSTIIVTPKNNPPSIISATSGTQNTDQITINVETDRACVCKYSLSGKSYSQMEYTFAQINAEKTQHEGKTPSLSQGSNTVYILCTDELGNYMASHKQVFLNVNLRPSASISLSPNPPLNEGTIKVALSTTEPLIGTPELKYLFDDDSTLRNVALIGSGTTWEGYIIIKDSDSERVGSFTFNGYDLTNLEGSEITSGKLFLIDTQDPEAIQSITIENMDSKIKLEWEKPDSEDAEEYKIYKKSESGGVETVDYYDSTDDEVFYDNDVEYNIGYYYRVSLVDEAGNEGPLSKEVFTTHVPVLEDSKISPISPGTNTIAESEKLNSKLEYILNTEIQKVEKIEKDLEKAEETLSRTLGTDNIDSIDALSAVSKLTENKNRITSLKTDLDELRNQNLDEMGFNNAVSGIMTQINSIWKETPIEIKILDSSSYQEFTSDEKTNNVVSAYLKEYYPDLSERDLRLKIEDTQKLQDKIVVNVKLIKGEIKYPEEVKPFSIVKKKYSADEDLGKIVLFESIPANVQDISQVEFLDQPFVKEDYAYWSIESINSKEITYQIYSDVNMADLKNVKSVALSEQDLIKEEEGNLITGDATGTTGTDSTAGEKSDGLFLVLIIVGVVVICGLFAYYIFWSEVDPEKSSSAQKENKETETEKEHNKSRFSAAGALFKRRESILPDDSHRKIIIDKPDEAIHQRLDSVEFRRFEDLHPPIPPFSTLGAGNQKINEMQASNQQTQSAQTTIDENSYSYKKRTQKTEFEHNIQFEELDRLQRQLSEMKNSTNVDDLEEFDALRTKTYEIKRLCDELEEQSVIEFTNKTKAHLEKSLLYIARHVPPDKKTAQQTQKEKDRARNDAAPKKEQNHKEILEIAQELKEIPAEVRHLTETKELEYHEEKELPSPTAPEGKEFIFFDGERVGNLHRLREKIKTLDDGQLGNYVNSSKNDFANWIRDIFKEYELAHKVRSKKNKEEIVEILREF